MLDTAEIKNLSRVEKLRIMEAIWADLSRDDKEVESPDWHLKALQETEQLVNSGQEKTIDWNTAKNELRNRFE
jgi:hypothetical protein